MSPFTRSDSASSTGVARVTSLALAAGFTGLLCCSIALAPARATTYTVCPTPPGNCNFTSIQHALTDTDSTTGNTILVSAGTYRPANEISISDKDASSPSSPTILQANGQVIIDCADPFADSTWTQHSGSVHKAARTQTLMTTLPDSTTSAGCQIHVDDIRYTFVNDTTYTTLAAGEWAYDASAQIVYVRLIGGGSPAGREIYIGNSKRTRGIAVRRSNYFVIDGFTIKRATGAGILIEGDAGAGVPRDRIVAIKNCNISHCWKQGITLSRTASAVVFNNTTHSNGDHGVHVVRSDSTNIIGNTSYLNDDPFRIRGGKNGIRVGNGDSTLVADINVDYNTVYENEDTGIELNGARRVVVRRNLIYRNRDHGVDNLMTSRTAYLNNVIFANDHDGISVENNARGVAVFNNIFMHNARRVATLKYPTDDISELNLMDTTGFVSNHNIIKPLPGTDIPGEGDSNDRHVVDYPGTGTSYSNTFRGYQLTTGFDALSDSSAAAFTDTSTADFTLSSGTTYAVDAAKTDMTGWLSPMWLSADPRGYVAHNSVETDLGAGSITYGDIGAFEFDAAPGPPTISVAAGRYDFVVVWDERGDDGDDLTAGTHEVYINGSGTTVVAAEAPGSPVCVDYDWNSCSPISVQVKITEADNGQVAWSNVVSTTTDCSGNQAYMCEENGLASGGGEESSMVNFDDLAGGQDVDYPLSITIAGSNPARSIAGVVYSVPKAMAGQPFDLSMFDIGGRRVALFGRGEVRPGRRLEPLPRSGDALMRLAPGVYFLRLAVADKALTKTVFLVP